MRLKIRTKLIGILFVAAVLPLAIGIIAIHLLGYHDYKRERGRLFEAVASHLAVSLDQTLDGQIERINDWVALAHLGALLPAPAAASGAALADDQRLGQTRADNYWSALAPGAPAVQTILTNDLAQALRQFQAINPLVAESQVTDAQGTLVAATRKPAHCRYGDQEWWQRTVRVRPGTVYLEGIAFDPSAGVYALDVCLPLRAGGRPSGAPAGVLRAVFNASRMFATAPLVLADPGLSHQIILTNGAVLFDLSRQSSSLTASNIQPAAVRVLTARTTGWTIARLDARPARLIGFAPLPLGRNYLDDSVPLGLARLSILVHDDAATALAPVRKQLWLIAGAGVLILLCFTLAGLYIATRKIVGPIHLLRSAAQTVAASAKLDESPQAALPATASPAAVRVLAAIERAKSGDELEDLARDFGAMARRILSYHERLEEQIAAKTAEIQSDLQMAREFQEALMPRSYPQIPAPGAPDSLRLRFDHQYQPARSVGGDFFDIHQLSDHRAGVFVADVMGHGARAALVTAMLHTLFHDLVASADEPARFLGLLNQRFAEIAGAASQGLFVSAFYVVIDTAAATATYACAGHPSPLVADRASGWAVPLLDFEESNPALGLFPETVYASYSRPVKSGDIFILFTDGVFEASGPGDEEFGAERLRTVVQQNLAGDLRQLTGAIVDAVAKFSQATALADDLCVVAVEVTDRQPTLR